MKAKKVGNKVAPWDAVSGWRTVDIGDDLLLGSDEFGFAGLEELDASALGDILGGDQLAVGGEAQPADEPGAAAAGGKNGRKEKQRGKADKKRKQPEAAAAGSGSGGEGGEESVEALRAKIAKLEKENRQLKGRTGGDGQQQPADKQQKQKRKQKQKPAEGQQGAEGAAAEDPAAGQAAAKPTKAAKAKARAEARAKAKAEAKAKRAEARTAKAAQQAARDAEGEREGPLADVSAWRDVLPLHPQVEKALGRLGFSSPTHVQAECLPAAVRDRRDVIGAAQTGSGKTLAFGLPIMQLLLQEREAQQAQQAQQEGEGGGGGGTARQGKLRALILAPTRELAMQVCEHLAAVGKVCGIWVVPIVGGISEQKQERLLSKHPEVVVATPGRLWDLMKLGQAHITDLSSLSFLIIDEADRMVQQGHYQELTDILAAIPKPSTQQEAAEEAAAAEASRRLAAGSQGAARGGAGGEGAEEGGEEGDEELAEAGSDQEEEGQEELEEEGASDLEDAAELDAGAAGEDEGEAAGEEQDPSAADGAGGRKGGRPGWRRRPLLQTFVFSATLTLPANLRRRLRKGGGGATGSASLDSLMDRIPFRPKPKIVDLTSQRKLADKVTEAYLECGESERDEYLYCILAKHPGRTLVFVNAISSVRRLGAILKQLGLPAHALHAGMQQRARLKALDRFKSDSNAILVATDVAARGLDVKDVRCVIHYQIPASVDVYVHRSGRTARAEAEGVSIALVTPRESARFLALLKALQRPPPPEFPVDLSLMPAAHKRVRLAVRLDEIARRQKKSSAEKSWRRQNAEALGIELSDDSEDEDAAEGRRVGKKARRDKGGARGPDEDATAEEVKAELAALLAEPLQPSFSKKYFTGGAAAAVAAHLGGGSVAPAAGGAKSKGKAGAAAEAAAEAGAAAGARKQQGKAAAGVGGEEGEGEQEAAGYAPAGATVSGAVQLAEQLAASRAKAAAEVKERAAKKNKQQKKKKKEGDPRAAALAAALAKHGAKKRGGAGRGLFVVPRAFGREATGPDALQALRSKLAAL